MILQLMINTYFTYGTNRGFPEKRTLLFGQNLNYAKSYGQLKIRECSMAYN